MKKGKNYYIIDWNNKIKFSFVFQLEEFIFFGI